MSKGKKDQHEETSEAEAQEETAPQANEGEATEREGSGAANLDYDFRIMPADPKNSFDFEDVADK